MNNYVDETRRLVELHICVLVCVHAIIRWWQYVLSYQTLIWLEHRCYVIWLRVSRCIWVNVILMTKNTIFIVVVLHGSVLA